MPKSIRDISDLTPDMGNANKGTERGYRLLDDSLREFGAGRSILTDKEGRVIAGNKTLEVAGSIGLPIRVIETDGNELVVVQRTDLDLCSEDQRARKLAYADNRAGELGLEWDAEKLLEDIASGLDLGGLWQEWEVEELSGDRDRGQPDDPGAQMDKAAELQVEWKTERGQVWEIPSSAVEGKQHRLMCGDSTSEANVGLLMRGEKAGLMNTDPPYGIDFSALKKGMAGFNTLQATGPIKNDELTDGEDLQAFLESVIRVAVHHLVENPAFYLWHPMLTQGTFFAAAAAAADILIHRQIIWVKPRLVLTRSGMYHWKHELCFYGWIRGKPCVWLGDKKQVSVWELGEPSAGRAHPTQKPVELFVRPIENHLHRGEIAYEPFSGSGSQLVAAEQTGRICYAMEIEPKYVAVALQRMADMGLQPRLVPQGEGGTIGG